MYGRFYSSQDAIGLLLATGNVGEYLSSKTNELNTYMSRDAGWYIFFPPKIIDRSWTEVSKGSLVYEMGDQGGILLFAENSVATNTMLYTWTEGLYVEISVKFLIKELLQSVYLPMEAMSTLLILW